ncbi:hypothetical protein D8S78_20905 [Natrialba swarupiae]|nr:hypothetical protein [Natrialba swarupiae]
MSTETHSAEPAADDATRDSTRTDDAVSASPRTGDVDTRARVTLLEAETVDFARYARAKRSSYRKRRSHWSWSAVSPSVAVSSSNPFVRS